MTKHRKSHGIYQHRSVMEKKSGRRLLTREVVHHVNLVRHDNSPDNLLLMRHRSTHRRRHLFLRRHGLKEIKFEQPWLVMEIL